MDKLELLERISKTTHFLNHADPEYMAVIKAMAETTNGLTLAYCLHMAYLSGCRDMAETIKHKTDANIEWSQAGIEMALDFNGRLEKK